MADIRETLLLEVHRLIEDAAREAASKLGRPIPLDPSASSDSPLDQSIDAFRAALLIYPPSDFGAPYLSPPETAALVGMRLSPEARSGLEKLFADAIAQAFFHFFCLLDGVADPEVRRVDGWIGAEFTAPSIGEHSEMLHDDFFESFQRYREQTQRAP